MEVCEAAGTRMQWSVFLCLLSRRELDRLRDQLLDFLDTRIDRLLIAKLDVASAAEVEHHGPPPSVTGGLTVV